MDNGKKIALGARLKKCKSVVTLGVKPDFNDYAPKEAELIRNAGTIYYPTSFYADLFNVMGKRTFPSFHTYKFVQDKIKQTAIFKMLKIPHPYTKVFYGKKQKNTILNYFTFPFIAKKPRNSSMGRGIYLIRNKNELSAYLSNPWPAYIQEYLPVNHDMRIIIIGKEIALSYLRIAKKGEFRSNISFGGKIEFSKLPQKALDIALNAAHKCGWDDVGMDIIEYKNKFHVVEANMKYGRKGFKQAGINYPNLLEELLSSGKI